MLIGKKIFCLKKNEDFMYFLFLKLSLYLILFLKSRNFLSPQHSKMKELESNGDVFGNSPGILFFIRFDSNKLIRCGQMG